MRKRDRRTPAAAFVFCAFLFSATFGRALDPPYEQTLLTLCDALVATQITDPRSADCGALVCPSTNPQEHPLHSRAAEAVYPLAIAFQRTHAPRYRDTAVKLAHWLFGKQRADGAWGEAWPNFDGWTGTTADQLLSLAGAYPVLRGALAPEERTAWEHAMRRAAAHILKTFPAGNINYQPTGAVALLLTAQVLDDPAPEWRAKARELIALTLAGINSDGLLVGEGDGVDAGYNLAQSVGYLALYGQLLGDESIRQRAADLLRAHAWFVYPNGAIDNSWGTRSYKWTYESGTKTAPGVYFSFALLADLDSTFGATGLRCLDYLTHYALRDGLVTGGPHVDEHASLTPPCLYSTFARAQSLALALVYAPEEKRGNVTNDSSVQKNSFHFFPTLNVAVVRTAHLMATVSAYGAIDRYGRGQVSRGGSLTNLWIDGFGRDGFAQTSSATVYKREEDIHMPIEPRLQPLTPRAECTINGVYYTNLFESTGKMTATQHGETIEIATSGRLRAIDGRDSGIAFELSHRFTADGVEKAWTFRSPRAEAIRVIEPFVRDRELVVEQAQPQRIVLRQGHRAAAEFLITQSDTPCLMTCGENAADYWSPFPGVSAYPIVVSLTTTANESTRVTTAFTARD